MKKTFYPLLLLAASLMLGAQNYAQSDLGPRKNTQPNTLDQSQVISASDIMEHRPDQPVDLNPHVPVHDEIHTPIRWYALENENNDTYWNGVDVSRIWIELELNASIYDENIQSFLAAHGLATIIHESRYKEKTNYWIFENPFETKESVLEMALTAQTVDGIKFLEPSAIYRHFLTPNDPLWEQQWGPYVTYFDEAWDYGLGGNSMNVVAVMDNACDWNHEDLYDQVWYGWDYVYNSADITPVQLTHDHGTHVTGTVAAKTNNGIGVAGMVNDTVYFAKVGDDQDGLVDQAIVDGLYDMADIGRISVINMSLGSESPSAAIEQACNYAWNNGKLLIVASGNNGQGFISFPAAFLSCVAVGSIGADGNSLYLTNYSQFGNEQEISAPGGEMQTGFGIVSCLPGNQYGAKEGTSMAAPHVTGLAGLMKNLNANLTNVDIRNILAATAFDYGDEGWDAVYGFGLINAVGAVEAALGITASTRDLNANEVMQLYPNPVADRLFIDMKIDANEVNAEIIDITGKLVKSIPLGNSQKLHIDVNDLNRGVYIIRMQTDKGIASTKFIKS
jgi:subtilisin family serine protease